MRSRRSPTCSVSSPAPRARCTVRSQANTCPGFTSMIRRDPVGVVASIAPWNYPLMMAAWKLSPGPGRGQHGGVEALRADAAHGAEARRDCSRSSFPPASSTSSPGAARRSAPRWSRSPRCAWCRSPASVARARRFSQAAAKGAKRTHLELGGKAPVIVFDDADLEVGRWRASAPSVSTTPGRIARPPAASTPAPKIYDKLVADLTAAAASIKVGTQQEEGVEMGPLISSKQRSRVAGFVDRAANSATSTSRPAASRAAAAASSTSPR